MGSLTLFSRHLPISSHMKHGREASILHGGLLSCFLLCTLLLILNLRSYVTKVRLTHPRCRVIEFGCAIFKVLPHPPPLQEKWWRACESVQVWVEELGLPLLCSVRASRADPGSQPDEIFSLLQSGRLSGEEVLCFCFPPPLSTLYPGKILRAWMLVFSSPLLPIHTDKTQASLTVGWAAPLKRWRCNIQGFPCLMCWDSKNRDNFETGLSGCSVYCCCW